MNMNRFTHAATALLSAAIALTGLTLLMRATDPIAARAAPNGVDETSTTTPVTILRGMYLPLVLK